VLKEIKLNKKHIVMKKLIIITLGIALGIHVMAQHHRPQKDIVQKLEEHVVLTSDQKAEIEKMQADFKAFRASEDFQNMAREEKTQVMKDQRKKVMGILTEEQKTAFKSGMKAEREEMKVMRDELKTYKETNIKPVLTVKRTEFDGKLSAEEKAVIAEVRDEVKAIRPKGGKDMRRGKSQMSEEDRAKLKAAKEKLKPIIQKHEAELKAIAEELKPQREKWKADIKAIKAKYGKEALVKEEAKNKRTGNHKKKGLKQTRFLLMETE
jgi:uncharacterized membrane protein